MHTTQVADGSLLLPKQKWGIQKSNIQMNSISTSYSQNQPASFGDNILMGVFS